MKKLNKQEFVDINIYWRGRNSIDYLIEDLNKYKKLGVTHIDIDISGDWGDAILEIDAIKIRQETDEEYKKRVNAENELNNRIEKKERAQLKKLQEKYNEN